MSFFKTAGKSLLAIGAYKLVEDTEVGHMISDTLVKAKNFIVSKVKGLFGTETVAAEETKETETKSTEQTSEESEKKSEGASDKDKSDGIDDTTREQIKTAYLSHCTKNEKGELIDCKGLCVADKDEVHIGINKNGDVTTRDGELVATKDDVLSGKYFEDSTEKQNDDKQTDDTQEESTQESKEQTVKPKKSLTAVIGRSAKHGKKTMEEKKAEERAKQAKDELGDAANDTNEAGLDNEQEVECE